VHGYTKTIIAYVQSVFAGLQTSDDEEYCLHAIITRMIKNKQRIGIAEKSKETRRDCWGGNVKHKSLFENVYGSPSQSWDLWFILPSQQSLLVFLLFSVIPIPCLKILFFYHSSLCFFLNPLMD